MYLTIDLPAGIFSTPSIKIVGKITNFLFSPTDILPISHITVVSSTLYSGELGISKFEGKERLRTTSVKETGEIFSMSIEKSTSCAFFEYTKDILDS